MLRSLGTLLPAQFVNDEVIMTYFRHLQRVNAQLVADGRAPPVHLFDTYFVGRLYSPTD